MRGTTTLAENWDLDAIPLEFINRTQVRDREDLFCLAKKTENRNFAMQ